MAGNVRTSSYNLRFDLPSQDRVLLMHGYTGALDIVSPRLADLLSRGGELNGEIEHDVRQALTDRGYLTAESEAQERDHVGKVLEVFERRQQPSVTLGLRLRGSSEELKAGLLSDLPGLFAALNSLRQYHVGGALALDLVGVTGEIDFFPEFAERAKEWSYALVLTLRERMASQLLPFLERDKIQYLRVISAEPGFGPEAAEALVAFFGQILDRGLRCDWLFSADGRSEEEIREAYERARQVKQMRKDRTGAVNSLFISERGATQLPLALDSLREPASVISTAEVPLYHHLCRFIEMPGLVNLRPYFAASDTNYVIDSSGEVSLVTRDARGGGRMAPVGRLADNRVELAADQPPTGPALAAPRSTSCDTCPYALICGVHCGAHLASETEARSCGEAFRQRVERIAPLMIFNKLQIV